MMEDLKNEYGRWFTKDQLSSKKRQLAQSISANSTACLRCGTPFETENHLPDGSLYCRECILLGRTRNVDKLYYFPQQTFPRNHSLRWSGTLTPAQEKISKQLCRNVQEGKPTLVHAVTGAGKTEMIYETLASVVDKGGAVCVASPRMDVCIELYHRLKRDFSCEICLLHGKSDPYVRSPIVVATTHQLLKFYRAFDLLLVDEVDAFPYVDNQMLYHGVENATKNEGVQVFMTATSTDTLDKMVKKGELERLSLPKRFHGHPLVVPQKVFMGQLDTYLSKNSLPNCLLKRIHQQRQTGYPLLIFAPEIKKGSLLANSLQGHLPSEKIGFVSSQTENRLEIVEKFRKGELTILISTTILERGVTFPFVDVFVVEAHHKLYVKSSLVQIAGRVGRSVDRPTGELLFFCEGSNRAIERAILEIKQSNREAGYA